MNRLYGVLNMQLWKHRYLAGDEYSIADMIAYPWTVNWKNQGQDIAEFPHFRRWFEEIGARHRLRIGNVFHAGDGNIHPIVLYDERDPDQVTRVLAAGREILTACVALGGSVTGEHGIGVEKIDFMPLLFTADDLNYMVRLRTAFNPENRCSPGKLLPTAGGCAEPSNTVQQTKPGRRAAV